VKLAAERPNVQLLYPEAVMALYDPFLAISDIFDADVLYTEGPGGPGPRGELSGAPETAQAACKETSAELCQMLTRHCIAMQSP